MKLSKRLSTIAELVPQARVVADIGCDHAYVAIELIRSGRAERVLACDIRKGPLEIARRNVEEAGYGEQIDLRLGDGLAPVVPGEADTVVIAGMGGGLVIDILKDRIHEFDRYVLSPQSELDKVRHFLHEKEMRIDKEVMVYDEGKYYTIMTVEQGTEKYENEWEYLYGKYLLDRRDEVLKAFLKKEYLRYGEILKQTQTETILKECDACIKAMRMYQNRTANDIMKALNEWAPPQAACEWDNPGLLVGRGDKEVERVFVALDATVEAIEEAVDGGCDMMITHHPMLFKAVKRINDQDSLGRKIMDLIKNDVTLFAMHTNFDACPGGMGDLVCERLGLKKTGVLEQVPVADEGFGIGFTAVLSEAVSCGQLAEQVKEAFGLPYVQCLEPDRLVRSVAVCPGSGRGLVREIISMKPDVFITGDMGHHEGLDLKDEGISVIDAGHYGLEHIFTEAVASYLRETFSIEVLQQEKQLPYHVL